MKLFLRSVVLLAIAIIVPAAFGQNTIWNNTSSDFSFETVSNWSNGVPDVGFSTYIFPGAHSDTTTPNTYFAGGTLNIIINASASHATDRLIIESGLAESQSSNGSVTMTFATGTTFTVGSSVDVAGTETFNFSGNLTLQSGSISLGGTPIYNTGAGTMNFSNGTLDLSAVGTALNVGLVNTGSAFTQSGSTASTVLLDQLNLGSSSSSGSYSITGTGANNLTLNAGGSVNMDDSTFLQNDASSTVDLSAAGAVTNLGLDSGATATYTLEAGTLMINNGTLGATAGSFGNLIQSGGSFISNGGFAIGALGTGTYTLSGTATADFQGGFSLGDSVGSTLTQSGSTALTSEGAVTIGTAGIGNYNLEGGTATFSAGLTVGATGTITQTGGTLTVAGGQTLDLTTAGSTYNLSGGTLQAPNDLTGAGTFNFGGGTLQPSAGPFTDSLNGTVAGTSTLDTTNADMTLSGTLNGVAGSGFNVIGGGAVTFSGANSGSSWGVNILNGTVNASASTFPSAGSVAIGSNGAGATGTFNLAVAGGTPHLFTGNITSIGNAGTGAFNINFATAGDTLELAGSSNSYNGQTTLAGGGTLRVFNGSFGSLGGNGAVAIGGDTAVATSGTVNFTGTNSYTGLTTVNDGFTLLTSNLTGNLTVTNLGTIGSGLTPATLPAVQATTVNLGGTFNSTGNILLNSNGNTTDLYTVTGASTLSGKVVLSGVGTTTNHVFINSPAGLNTAGLTLVTAGQGVLFTGSIQQIGNTEVLTTTQNPTSAFAQTPNQQAVSTVIDPILTGTTLPAGAIPILTGLNNLSASQIPAGLEQLTPESLQYARDIAFENSTFLAQRMNNVCADLRAGYGGLDTSMINVVAPGFDSGMGRSLGSFFAYNDPSFHSAAPNGVNYYPGGESTSPAAINGTESDTLTPAAAPWDSSRNVITDSPNPYLANSNPSGPETPRLSEFISGDVVLADLNTNQNTSNAASSKASYTAGDVTAGISFRMTSHLAAGILFDYNHTDAKTDSNGSKTQIDSYSPGLFATYYDHGFYANGLFSFGYNNYSNKRNIGFLGDTASSSPSGQQYVGNLDLGYDFKPAKGWIAGPTLGMTYTHLDVDSFTETGAPGADLAVDSQSADSFRTRLGGHVGYSTNTGDVLLTPNFTAMWQHEFLDNSSGITSSFNDFSSNSFTIQTAAPSRDSALIGIGLSATLSNSMTLYINYLADVGATNYFAQSVVGGFKARF